MINGRNKRDNIKKGETQMENNQRELEQEIAQLKKQLEEKNDTLEIRLQVKKEFEANVWVDVLSKHETVTFKKNQVISSKKLLTSILKNPGYKKIPWILEHLREYDLKQQKRTYEVDITYYDKGCWRTSYEYEDSVHSIIDANSKGKAALWGDEEKVLSMSKLKQPVAWFWASGDDYSKEINIGDDGKLDYKELQEYVFGAVVDMIERTLICHKRERKPQTKIDEIDFNFKFNIQKPKEQKES